MGDRRVRFVQRNGIAYQGIRTALEGAGMAKPLALLPLTHSLSGEETARLVFDQLNEGDLVLVDAGTAYANKLGKVLPEARNFLYAVYGDASPSGSRRIDLYDRRGVFDVTGADFHVGELRRPKTIVDIARALLTKEATLDGVIARMSITPNPARYVLKDGLYQPVPKEA